MQREPPIHYGKSLCCAFTLTFSSLFTPQFHVIANLMTQYSVNVHLPQTGADNMYKDHRFVEPLPVPLKVPKLNRSNNANVKNNKRSNNIEEVVYTYPHGMYNISPSPQVPLMSPLKGPTWSSETTVSYPTWTNVPCNIDKPSISQYKMPSVNLNPSTSSLNKNRDLLKRSSTHDQHEHVQSKKADLTSNNSELKDWQFFSPVKLLTDDIPNVTPYWGHYNFNVFVPDGEYDVNKESNRQHYVFHTDGQGTNDLFTKPFPHFWPLDYRADPSLSPKDMYIRLTPVYAQPKMVQRILERCPKHTRAKSDSDLINRSVLIVQNADVRYFLDQVTQRLCVLLKFKNYSTIMCQFCCYSSCFNQSAKGQAVICLIVTLEYFSEINNNFEVYGRQVFNIRSCACPYRDWRTMKLEEPQPSSSSNKEKNEETMMKIPPSTPIQFNSQELLIRVLPALPGLDEAVNNIITGFLMMKNTQPNNNDKESITKALDQMKQFETFIVDQCTLDMHYDLDSQSQSETVSDTNSSFASSWKSNATFESSCYADKQDINPCLYQSNFNYLN